MCDKGGVCMVKGKCMAKEGGAYMVKGGRGGMCGRGHVWWGVCGRGPYGRGVCMTGGVHGKGCAWQDSMCDTGGGHVCRRDGH